jgi:6-phosphogluconolactonase (cycloisomerase 2 family)
LCTELLRAKNNFFFLLQGAQTTVTNKLATQESAACWLKVTSSGALGYVSNTGSNTITSLSLTGAGAATLLQSAAASANLFSPHDLANVGDTWLYVLNGASPTNISYFAINSGSGALTAQAVLYSVPTGAQGLVTTISSAASLQTLVTLCLALVLVLCL